MSRCSNRGRKLGDSPIRILLPFAEEARRKGRRVLHLNIGQPDIPTPPEALEAVRKVRDRVIAYGPAEGLPSLREAVAGYYDRFDANISREDVFVTTGASEAILYTLFACMDPGDELIVPQPFYANYLGYAEMASVRIVPLTTYLEDGFRLPGPEAFEDIISERTRAILLVNPSNPTGQMYDRAALEAVARIAVRHDLFLIVDEVYREFCYDIPFFSALALPDAEENVIVIDSISKVFSSCGARIGFLISKNEEVRRTVFKYAELRLSPPYLGQVLAEVCYRHGYTYIRQALETYRERRRILYNGLSEMEDILCYKPQAAFYNMIQFPFEDAVPFCRWLLSDFSLDGHTVMLSPADGFYFDAWRGKSQVRLAYVLADTDLQLALNCLSSGLTVYRKKHAGHLI